MFESLKQWLLVALRLPTQPPRSPRAASEAGKVFRASPRYLSYRLVATLSGLALSVGVMWAVMLAAWADHAPRWALLLLGAVLVGLLGLAACSYFLIRLDYELRYYLVTDRSLLIREGAWILREQTLSFENVQNVTVEQGPVERLLGIANVVVHTAGGGGTSSEESVRNPHQGALRGVENAHEVRDLIRARLDNVHRRAGLGDLDEEGAGVDGGRLAEALREVRAETRALADTTSWLPGR